MDPSASRGQVPTAVACRDDSDGDGSEGPPFQQRCAWPRQSQSEELGSLEGLLQAAFRGQRGTESGGAPARSGPMHQTHLGHRPRCTDMNGWQ